MKHAILMLVDKDLDQIKRIISLFDKDFYFFIHIDKKSTIEIRELSDMMTNGAHIQLVSKQFKINWGSFNMIKATLYLIDEVLKVDDIGYAHLISGQDYLIKNLKTFKAKFENCNSDFIESQPFPIPWKSWKNGGFDRLNYYYFFDILNPKGKLRRLNFGLLKLQKKIGVNRSYPKGFPKLYAGSQWWSLTRSTLEKLNTYILNNRNVVKRFKYVDAPDEIFISTLVSNLNLDLVKNLNLRLIDWNERDNNGIMPVEMDTRDWDNIKLNTTDIFARKINSRNSNELMNLIDTNILNIE